MNKRNKSLLTVIVIFLGVYCLGLGALAIFRRASAAGASKNPADQVAFERTKLAPDSGWTGEVIQCEELYASPLVILGKTAAIYKVQVKRSNGAIDNVLSTSYLAPTMPVKYVFVNQQRNDAMLPQTIDFVFATGFPK